MRRDATIRHRIGRGLTVAAACAAGWAWIVLVSGGVSFHTGVSLIVARDPSRPMLAAVAVAALAWILLGTRAFGQSLRRIAGDPRTQLPTRAAIAAAASTLVVAMAWNTRAAGGSDSSCYVLQAEAFAHGRATLAPPLSPPLEAVPPAAMAPIGFVPSPTAPHNAVPICAPGLALVMVPAFFIHANAVFLVVPLFAALAVWCTFLLGRAVENDSAGACGAVLLACSPIFLYQAVQPMSDVPAAALWLAVLVALRPSGGESTAVREIVAGVCASMAVLMRPNIALIVVPLLVLLPFRVRPWARFAAASFPALITMLALNAARYGSPFASGYGDTGVLFSFAHVGPNLARYPRWLFETHTPFVALAIVTPLLSWRPEQRRFVAAAIVAVALTFATYVAYTVFDDWWYIRFLLPALPVLLVFALIALTRAVPMALVCVVTVVLSGWSIHVARTRAVFELAALEARFRLAGEYAGRALTDAAIVLAVQQSGSVRYYGGRGTLAWDGVPADRLDAVVAALEQSGRRVFFVLEDGEAPRFRERFAGQRSGALDWPPFAEVRGAGRVRFYDPRQRTRFLAGERFTVEIVGGRSPGPPRR
jgi:hypothetical protein